MLKKSNEQELVKLGEQYQSLINAMGGTKQIHYTLGKIGFLKLQHEQTEAGEMITEMDIATLDMLNEYFHICDNSDE